MVSRDRVLNALKDLRAQDDASMYPRAQELFRETGLGEELSGMVFGDPLDGRFRLLFVTTALASSSASLKNMRSLVDELIVALS